MGIIFDDIHRIANIPVQIAIAGEDLYVGDIVQYKGYDESKELAIMERRNSYTSVVAGFVGKNTRVGEEFVIIRIGKIININTGRFAVGDLLYPDNKGGFTNTKVVDPTLVNQNIGYVVVSSLTDGVIDVNVVQHTDKAQEVAYTNTTSKLASQNVKGAIDELDARTDTSEARLLALETKMNGIEEGATRDQTPIEIKTLYESLPNTNEYDDDEQRKVSLITISQPVNLDDIEGKSEQQRNAIGTLVNPMVHVPLISSLDFPIGKGFIDFERVQTSSTGTTYIDRYNNLAYATAHEPRFEQNGLLIEGPSTNYHLYSHITNLNWYKTRCTVEDDAIPFPDTLDSMSSKITCSLAGTINIYRYTPVIAGRYYTQSYFVKAGNISELFIGFAGGMMSGGIEARAYFNLVTKEITTSGAITNYGIQSLNDGWYRIFASVLCGTSVSGNVTTFLSSKNSVAIGNYFYADKAQLEEMSFMTSFIPTLDTPITRAQDKCALTFKDNALNADTNQTWVVDFNIPSLKKGNIHRGIIGVENETLRYIKVTATNTMEAVAFGGGDMTKYSSDKFRWTSVGVNGTHTGYVNAGGISAVSAGANSSFVSFGGERRIILGGVGHSDIPLYGNIKNFKIYDIALTTEQMRLA